MRLELYWSGLAAASIGSNSRSAQECIATRGVAVARGGSRVFRGLNDFGRNATHSFRAVAVQT